MSGKVNAFAQYGVALKNDQWSWSGISESGEVILALWQDQFDYRSKPVSYSTYNSPILEEWKDRLGNRERIANLIHARENCRGEFRAVIVQAVDKFAEPRKVKEAFAKPREPLNKSPYEISISIS
jgi:hypothetical protein